MTDFETIQNAVREYARDYIRAQRARKRSYAEIAAQLDVTHVWVMQLEKGEATGKRGAGGKVEHRLAELLHGGSIDSLRKAALAVASGCAVTVEVEGEALELARVGQPLTGGTRRKRAR
jgi:hypothetical protein